MQSPARARILERFQDELGSVRFKTDLNVGYLDDL